MLFLSSPPVLFHRARIAELAVQHRMAAVYPYVDMVEAGGLATYGVNIEEQFRRAATFVDKLLRGAKPAELPIELPTTFVLVVHRGAAKRIGLDIPPPLLARADRILD
jgi:putative ABC transport system substrate-binding protein